MIQRRPLRPQVVAGPPSFHTWACTYQCGDPFVGDAQVIIKTDPTFPKDASTLSDVDAYLKHRGHPTRISGRRRCCGSAMRGRWAGNHSRSE